MLFPIREGVPSPVVGRATRVSLRSLLRSALWEACSFAYAASDAGVRDQQPAPGCLQRGGALTGACLDTVPPQLALQAIALRRHAPDAVASRPKALYLLRVGARPLLEPACLAASLHTLALAQCVLPLATAF